MSSTIADIEKLKTIGFVLGLIILLLIVLTVVVYWLFLDKKIKNKKTMLSSLISKYKIVIYTVFYCTGINLMFLLIMLATKFESLGSMYGIMLQLQFCAYLAFLLVPRIFIFCLQISVKKEEKEEKIKFLEALKLFWSISKKN